MGSISVRSGQEADYEICFSRNIFDVDNNILLNGRDEASRNCLIVVDENVYSLHAEKINLYFTENVISFRLVLARGGESNKTLHSFLRLFDAINDYPLNRRNEPLIIIGGGVVTDVTAFSASCFRRGLPHIKVPTTLMGYVDAAIGIKNGINYGKDKNRMGAFYPPISVVLDRSFISSQAVRDISNGIGEVIKIALIKNVSLFEDMECHIVKMIQNRFQCALSETLLRQAVIDMLEELSPNLYETQLERLADFGHTFSLAFEMHSAGNILHGYAGFLPAFISAPLVECRRFQPGALADLCCRDSHGSFPDQCRIIVGQSVRAGLASQWPAACSPA